MIAKKPTKPVQMPWKVTSTGASNEVEFTAPAPAEKFWQDLVSMYPNQIHTIWHNGKIIKHN